MPRHNRMMSHYAMAILRALRDWPTEQPVTEAALSGTLDFSPYFALRVLRARNLVAADAVRLTPRGERASRLAARAPARRTLADRRG